MVEFTSSKTSKVEVVLNTNHVHVVSSVETTKTLVKEVKRYDK